MRSRSFGIADIAHDELYAVLGKARDVGGITRIGELVENGHVHIRMVVHHVVHEVRTYEPTAARDDNVGGRANESAISVSLSSHEILRWMEARWYIRYVF